MENLFIYMPNCRWLTTLWLFFFVTLGLGISNSKGDDVGASGAEAAKSLSLPGRIRVTMVDDPVIHYATFQSHNQKVVEGGGLIFMSHLRSRNEEYTNQCWRLSVSQDGGASFVTFVERCEATNPPVLECDQQGNLYLVRVDFVSGDAYLDRWEATKIKLWLQSRETNSLAPQTTRIPGGAAGKYAAVIDKPRHQLYFFSHNNSFHRLRLDGTLVDSRQLTKDGPNGLLQYPQLSLNPHGQLHLAWTTQKHGEYMYRDIHHVLSDDGGNSFCTWLSNREGGRSILELPIIADETGPALRVTLDDEFEVHTWLACGLATAKHWHGLYLAQTNPARQHYVRYDLQSGEKQIDRYPQVAGESLSLKGLDGFFAHNPTEPDRLFVIGNDSGHLVCLVSDNAGETWHDYARSEQPFGLYSIGGYRQITADGAVIGSFTDQQTPESITDRKSKVFFFRIESEKR